MSSANKRIMTEFNQASSNPVDGTSIRIPDESNVFRWEVNMEGPPDSVYAGGRFRIEVALPKEYPFKPPVLSFKTKIYHPNVTNDDKGSMCLGILRPDAWKPPNRIVEVVRLVRSILVEPVPDDAVEASIADQYRKDPAGFAKVAKEWVNKFAK